MYINEHTLAYGVFLLIRFLDGLERLADEHAKYIEVHWEGGFCQALVAGAVQNISRGRDKPSPNKSGAEAAPRDAENCKNGL